VTRSLPPRNRLGGALADFRGSAKNERSSTVQIIYAGNITPIRGLREVVQAMKLVTDCDVVLNLVGLIYPDDFQQEIRILAGPNVILYGKMPFEESQQLVRCSDIGVVTFHPLANHVEALPNKLFEYMQNGLPVIASDFPIWKNIIEQVGCGIAVDPLKPEEIAAAIRKLANDPALRHEMGEAGIKAVKQKYSWEREQNILLQLYRELSACPDKTAY
jgi:glycosyltransferase involved in cell wall biosynthesis